MELMPTLKLGPRSVAIIGNDLEANRARDEATETFFASISTNTTISTTFVVDHRNVVVS